MSKFPGWRTMTSAQRRNAKMDAMFERARQLGHATFRAERHAENVDRCAHCDAGPLGNCGAHGAEMPRERCPHGAR